MITARTEGFDQAVDEANQKLNELGKGAEQAGQGIGKAADQLTMAGGLAAAAGAAMLAPLVGAVKGAADFEFAMDGVNAALGGVDTATLDMLEAQALDLGASTKFSATEIAGVQEQLAKTGLTAEDLLDGATKSVTDLAAATGESLPQSASAAASAMHAFGLQGEDMSRVADIITGTLNNSSTSLAGYEMGINNLGPVLSNMNKYQQMTAEGLNGAEEAFIDTSAAVGYFNQQGMKAADAGLSLARGITFLSKPTAKAAELISELGIEAFDMEGNFKSIPDLMDELNESMSGMSDVAREAALSTIFGAEAADVMNKAIKRGGDPLRAFTEKLREEGVAAKQAELRQQNLTSKVEQLGGALNGLAIQMGTPLLDPLTKATEGITEMVNVLAGAPPEVQKLVSEFGALTGGLLTFGGLAALGTGQVLKLGQQFAAAGLSLPKFAAGLGLVGLAIGAGLLAYETNFMGFADFVDENMAKAGKAVETFGRVFDEAFFENQNAEMGKLAAGIAAFGTAWDAATGMDISKWTRKAAEGVDVLTDSFEAGQKAGVDPWVNALESAAKASRAMGNEQLARELHTLSGAWDAMQRSMTETEGKMPQLNREMSALQAGLQELFGDEVEDALGVTIPEAFDNIGSEFARMQDDITTGWNNITGETERAATDVKGFLDNVGAGFSNIGAEAARSRDNVTGWLEDVGTGFSNIGSEASRTIDDVTKWFDALDNGMSNLATERPPSEQLAGWFQDASDQLMGREALGPGDKGAIKGLIPQLSDDLAAGFAGLGDAVGEKLQSIGNPFDGVTQWLQQGMDEVNRFFQPQEMSAGLGGGMGDTSGISQMFSGMVDGIGAGMDQAVADLGALASEKKEGFTQALGDLLGPIGQFLFPSQDALAGGEGSPLGDPAKMGEQFGASLLSTFTDPAFEDSLMQSIDAMPDEAFQATGAALLGAINKGMETAMTQPMPTEGGDATGAGQTMGQQMVQSLANGLTTSLQADGARDALIPAVNAFGNAFNSTLGEAMTSTLMQQGDNASQGRVGAAAAGGIGGKLVQSLADGLTTSLMTEGTADKFIPAVNALGSVLNTAMQQTAQQGTQQAGDPAQQGQAATGFGQQMVQGLASGLANGITAADPAMFVPVTNALGTQLGAAMQMASQQTQAPGGVGPAGPAVPGMGETMVQGLATGLANGITAADPAMFVPVSNALGTQLGAAMSMAAQQTGVHAGLGGVPGQQAAGGIGSTMVQGLATGLADSITAAPIETFTPVGAALGTKLGEALQAAVETGAQQGGAGQGADTAGIGAQMGESVGQMLISGVEQADFTPVGAALGTKLGETLQTVAEGGGEFDISEQVGTSVGSMLQTGIEQADFTGVGDQLSSQLSDQMNSAIEDVSSQIEEQMSQITEAISQAVEEMGEAISEATESVSSAVEEMSGAIEEATSAVSAAVEEMSSAVEEAVSGMEEAASGAVEAMEPIASAAEEAAAAVAAAMAEMAASVEAAVGQITAAAGQIVAALNSIAAAAGAIGGAAGNALSGGFSDATGIASPSKVFMKHGQMITAGLAVGMQQGQGIPKAAKTLAGLSMSAVGNAIGMGSPAKKFMPHGAAITDGMLAGMMQQAKGRLQSAMGKMAGAVEGAMGKVKSAVSGAMERVKGQAAQGGAAAGAAAAAATGEGMGREERQAERAAQRLWRRAYKELMKGVGAARFLGEEWSREFWEGMLDDSGSLEFAQYVTEQIAGAAENAVAAALGRIQGLATQLEIVADRVSDLQGEITSLESEQSSLAGQTQQARLTDLQRELSLQRSITQELENRLKTEVSSAHLAHIRAVQTRSVGAQADYEQKLRTAQATDTARAESAIRETELAAVLDAMQQQVQRAAQAELAARQATVAAELAAKRQQLAAETALHASLQAQQMAAQRDYTAAVIVGSQDRLKQLQKELRKASGADRKQTIKAEIALEQQRIATAQQLATALDQVTAASNPEQLAQANAQVQFLTAQLAALGQVDAGSLLEEIASKLGAAASSLGTAASSLGDAATALGSTDASAGMNATASAAGNLGQQIEEATGGMFSMAAKYKEVTDQMNAETLAFQQQFKAMTDKTAADAAAGGEDIGLALSEGITGKITEGGPAMQQTMLQQLQTGMAAAEGEADSGGTDIAGAFGAAMRGQLGVELPKVHQDILGGMTQAVDATQKEAQQGGKDVMTDFGTAALGKLEQESGRITSQMKKPISDGVSDARKIASQGGKDIGGDLASGVQQGVQSQATNIANTAAQTVRDAIQAARDAAKAKSPSRRMMDLGDDMGLGLVLGLRGRHDDAEDASSRLVHIPMIPTSSGGVSGRRAYEERHGGGDTNYYFERLELPNVTNADEFFAALERRDAANGVASGR